MVIDKVSIINPLPASYEQQLKQIEGVQDVTHSNWFGGYYQEVKNQFATFAVDPESWLRVYPKEFDAAGRSEEGLVRRSHRRHRRRRHRKEVRLEGRTDASRSRATIYRRPDGGPWEFTIDGIYDSNAEGGRQDQLHLQLRVPARDDSGPERVPRQVQLVRRSRSPIPTARRRSPRRSTRCSPTLRRRPRPTPRRRSCPTGPSRSATSARS